MNAIEQKILDILLPTLKESGYEVVRVQIRGKTRKTVQIMIERLDRQGVAMDDCVEVSNMASALLDIDDPLGDAYLLEVTSPGLDRPLVKPEDYVRFTGSWVKLHTLVPMSERQRFMGKILGAQDAGMTLFVKDTQQEIYIPFDNIKKANLVPDYDIKDA